MNWGEFEMDNISQKCCYSLDHNQGWLGFITLHHCSLADKNGGLKNLPAQRDPWASTCKETLPKTKIQYFIKLKNLTTVIFPAPLAA